MTPSGTSVDQGDEVVLVPRTGLGPTHKYYPEEAGGRKELCLRRRKA